MKISFFLLIAESALQKLPELFVPFLREGILDFLEKLSNEEEMKFLQLFPLFKTQPKYNPSNIDFKQHMKYAFNTYNKDFLNKEAELYKEFPLLDKQIEMEQPMEEEFFSYDLKDKQPMDPNMILQTIQKDSKETEETLKEIEQEINTQSTEKHKYLELFQKFKKTKEKIQQTAELLQKTHKKVENNPYVGLKLDKKEQILKPALSETEINLEKIKEIKIELNKLAKKILFQIKTSKDYNSLDISSSNEIMGHLNEIMNLLKNNMSSLIQNNEEDFGLKGFQIFINVLEKYKRITLYELKNSNIVKSLLDFLLDGTTKKISLPANQKLEVIFEEEVKSNQEIVEKKNEEVNLTNQQISTILKRIFVFIYVFLKKSPMNPQGFILFCNRFY